MKYCEINEARSAPLYHSMDYEKSMDVFDNDVMPARWVHDIPGIGPKQGNSFSRNKFMKWADNPVTIVVDQTKLSHRHKIIPLDGELVHYKTIGSTASPRDRVIHTGDRSEYDGEHIDEQLAEEFVLGDIKNLHTYITRIELNRDELNASKMIDLYKVVRTYSKKWGISLKVDPKYMKKMIDAMRRWRAESEEDNEAETERRWKENIANTYGMISKNYKDGVLIPMPENDLNEMAKPTEFMASTVYYHGTKYEAAAQGILATGLQPGNQSENARGKFKPVVGRSYITPRLEYAVIYAIGGIFMGCDAKGVEYLTRNGERYGYIFVIDGKDLVADVQPDEDSVGEAVMFAHRILERGQAGSVYDDDPLYANMKARGKNWLEHFLWKAKSYLTPRQFRDAINGEMSAQASGGKRLLKNLSDSDKLDLINMGAHVAYQGSLVPSQCWKFDKELTPGLKKDGSNFFELAVRIR